MARQLGVGDESLRAWVKQSEIDAGARAGLSKTEQAELKELRKEVRELRRSKKYCGRPRLSSGRSSTAGKK